MGCSSTKSKKIEQCKQLKEYTYHIDNGILFRDGIKYAEVIETNGSMNSQMVIIKAQVFNRMPEFITQVSVNKKSFKASESKTKVISEEVMKYKIAVTIASNQFTKDGINKSTNALYKLFKKYSKDN